MRLDRFISNLARFSRQDARQLLASGRLQVDQKIVLDGRLQVSGFNRIVLDDELLQAGKAARYFMLHKPAGVVSATCHPQHKTVLDLLDLPDKSDLHLAGRLDLNTTGLLLITNDGLWSRQLTLPQSHQPKTYWVETAQPITQDCVEQFKQGIYFANETLTTLPAALELLGTHTARLTLHEGRHHQIKRMFAHFQNPVIGLHRESVGVLQLDPQLAPGQYRSLSTSEIKACAQKPG